MHEVVCTMQNMHLYRAFPCSLFAYDTCEYFKDCKKRPYFGLALFLAFIKKLTRACLFISALETKLYAYMNNTLDSYIPRMSKYIYSVQEQHEIA